MVAQPERTNDIYIMQYARECGLFDKQALKIINYCRLYLHVTTISELFESDGRTINPFIFACQREPWFNPKTYISLQRRPSGYQIRTKWQRLLRQWTTSEGHLAASMTLGAWKVRGQDLRRHRPTYIPNCNQQVRYHWKESSYWEYHQDELDYTKYRPVRATEWLPVDLCIPTQGILHDDGTLIDRYGSAHSNRNPSSLLTPTTFHSYLASLQQWERDLLQGVQLQLEPFEIVHFITGMNNAEELIAVSDGSQRGSQLTYGWVVGSTHGRVIASHSGDGVGNLTSHRAEAWGMLSASLFLYHVVRYTGALVDSPEEKRSLLLYSDNNGLIQRVTQQMNYTEIYPNATLAPDWDLITQIVQTIRRLTIFETKAQWVRGHQDESADDLPIEAKFNIRADVLAGNHQSCRSKQTILRIIVPAERCTLEINQQTVHGHYMRAIRHAYTIPSLYDYLEHRYQWTLSQRVDVDWLAFEQAANNMMISSTQLLKLVYAKLPTNAELSKSNVFHTSQCHYCDDRETFYHLCRCANEISDQFRQEVLREIDLYCEHRQVSDEFKETFILGLRQALDIVPHKGDRKPSPRAQRCLETQTALGAQSLLQGFLTSQWTKLYFDSKTKYGVETTIPAVEVLAGLIKILWKAQLKLWSQHLESVKNATATPIAPQIDQLHHYRAQIRSLHSQRHLCLHGHRDLYFYPDVEQYLNTATKSQMKSYLHHYEPAIQASIRAATDHQTKALFTFPGFQRLSHRHPTNPTPRTTNNTRSKNTVSDERGASINRKHTRWRVAIPLVPSIRQFFSEKPD